MRPYSSRTGAEPGARSASGFSSLRASVNRSRSKAAGCVPQGARRASGMCDGPASSSSSAALGSGRAVALPAAVVAPSCRGRSAPVASLRMSSSTRTQVSGSDRRSCSPAASRKASEAAEGRSSFRRPLLGARRCPSSSGRPCRPSVALVAPFRSGRPPLRGLLRLAPEVRGAAPWLGAYRSSSAARVDGHYEELVDVEQSEDPPHRTRNGHVRGRGSTLDR